MPEEPIGAGALRPADVDQSTGEPAIDLQELSPRFAADEARTAAACRDIIGRTLEEATSYCEDHGIVLRVHQGRMTMERTSNRVTVDVESGFVRDAAAG